MAEFVGALIHYRFLQTALLTAVLGSLCCGVVGTYVVTRRISYIAGGIAHCTLGGIGVARYLQVTKGWEWFEPLYGALAAAVIAATLIGLVTLRAREREDTIIGATWAIGMAVGILFISQTPGYNEDIMGYLFGNILMVTPHEVLSLACLDAVILAVCVLFYKPFLAVCFDEEYARLRGLPVEFYYLLLLLLTAVTVVLLVTVVGIILVIALLTLPPAVSGHFTKRLWKMMVLSTLFCLFFCVSGLFLSFRLDFPAGATMILVAGAVYLGTLALSSSWPQPR